MCECGSIFVDGGKDYLRRGGIIENIEDMSEIMDVEIESSLKIERR
jgi:hypothetical protein